jgi:hypothetical protein
MLRLGERHRLQAHMGPQPRTHIWLRPTNPPVWSRNSAGAPLAFFAGGALAFANGIF